MTVTDSLDRPLCGHNVETSAASDGNLADINALFLPIRDDSPDEITGAKAFDCSRGFGRRAWETVLVHPAHLSRIVTDCLDAQRPDICRIQSLRCALTDTGRVYPMLFG